MTHYQNEPSKHLDALSGESLPEFFEPISAPIGTTEPRWDNSVRRTMSIDVHWPGGSSAEGHFVGRARDIITIRAADPPSVIDEATVDVQVANREVLSISSTPTPPRLTDLIGVRAGGNLRAAIDEACPEEKQAGTPLHLLLDDLAGATLVAGWAFSDSARRAGAAPHEMRIMPVMRGTCIGFRSGSNALDSEGRARADQNSSVVVPLTNPDDPDGWHAFPQIAGINFRRARRIDVWREGPNLAVTSHFQDSVNLPGCEERLAVHEYLVSATVNAAGQLITVEARPGTLPYAACRVATYNLAALLGTHVGELRDAVLTMLKGSSGCTHLNDVARSLADVPILAAFLKD